MVRFRFQNWRIIRFRLKRTWNRFCTGFESTLKPMLSVSRPSQNTDIDFSLKNKWNWKKIINMKDQKLRTMYFITSCHTFNAFLVIYWCMKKLSTKFVFCRNGQWGYLSIHLRADTAHGTTPENAQSNESQPTRKHQTECTKRSLVI